MINLRPETHNDVLRLIEAKVSESEELEFKQALSTSDGNPDVWMTGADRIGKIAKRELAKEIIAFANTRGGTLILGIGEDGEKRAATSHPIPKCRDLADRLGQSIAASVDPILGSLEAWGVESDDDGNGYVVLRVPASYRAPHRDRDERECYRRICDRSEPMDMRAIHDLVLLRSRGIETVQAILNQRSAQVKSTAPRKSMSERQTDTQSRTSRMLMPCLVRATAMPLEPIAIDDLFGQRQFHFRGPMLKSGHNVVQHAMGYNWSPVLRGIQADEGWEISRRVILANGMVETVCDQTEFELTQISPSPVGFPMEFFITTVAHAVLLAAALRTRIGRPDLEFALDVEWRFPDGAKLLLPTYRMFSSRTLLPIEQVSRVSDYLIPKDDQLGDLMAILERDFLGSFGQRFGRLFDIDMQSALAEMLA